MKELQSADDILLFCKALSSEVRLRIVEILGTQGERNLNELAAHLGVTNGAMTAHIRLLAEAGIISVRHSSGKRGSQKTCSLVNQRYLLNLMAEQKDENSYKAEIPIGQYSAFRVQPTCGIATASSIIGEVDDSRYFDSPLRVNAGILWLTDGYLEYRIPNYLRAGQELCELQVSFEISSEAPTVNNQWPSDILFSLNEHPLGVWTSPGDFGDTRGMYAPDWWPSYWNQYGLLKLLKVTKEGSFIDGVKISNCTVDTLKIDPHSELRLRMEVQERDGRAGGLTLFGRHFGNYNQDIIARVCYTEGDSRE